MYSEHPIEWDDAKVARLWGCYSRTPPYSDIYFSKVFGAQILKQSGIALRQEMSVLDFGCGPGFIWEHMQQLDVAWSYTGVDFSADSVVTATQRGAGHDRFKGVSHIRGLPTEFPDYHFDAVLLLEVVEHLTDEHLNGMLNEVFRLLKPGGVVVITTPNDEDLSVAAKHCPECGAIFHEWQHVRSWNATTLAGHMGGFGFVSQFASPTDFWEHGLIGTAMVKARRILTGRRKRPHLIGTFLKP